MVLHTAGPFQRGQHSNVLKAALAKGVPYMDVAETFLIMHIKIAPFLKMRSHY